MQTVYLNGGIAQFGEKWTTDCASIRDIFKLIECQNPGFRKYMIDAAENGVGYEIQRGFDFLEQPEELLLSLHDEDIIITEVPAGAKSGGAKILAALAIAALFFIPGTQGLLLNTAQAGAIPGGAGAAGSIGTMTVAAGLSTPGLIAASLAVNLALTGITQLLTSGPEVDEQKESYLFNGPVNTIKQGLPVPVLYGEMIVGGSPISVYYSSNPLKRGLPVPFEANSPINPGENDNNISGSSDGLTDEDYYGDPEQVSETN